MAVRTYVLMVGGLLAGISSGAGPAHAAEAAAEAVCTPYEACKTAYRWTRQPQRIEKCRSTGARRACRWTIEFRRTKVPYQICRTRQRCADDSVADSAPAQN